MIIAATALALIGSLTLALIVIGMATDHWPRLAWWPLKALPLQNTNGRDYAASLAAGARRAYLLPVPFGVRVVVAVGGTREDQLRVQEDLTRARALNAVASQGQR